MRLIMTKILVTGGAGFIGSHLVDRLIKEDKDVTVLDNVSNGSLENLKEHLKSNQLTMISGDIRKKSDVKKALKDASTVFHLAALVNVPLSIKNPKLTRDVNVNGTRNVLEASVAENIEKFILISSCAVYGEAQYLPIDETHPISPCHLMQPQNLRQKNTAEHTPPLTGLRHIASDCSMSTVQGKV